MLVPDALSSIWTFSSSSTRRILFKGEVPLWFTSKEWTELSLKLQPLQTLSIFLCCDSLFLGVTVSFKTHYVVLGFAVLTSVSRSQYRVSVRNSVLLNIPIINGFVSYAFGLVIMSLKGPSFIHISEFCFFIRI